jgi:hypothetical protein
MKSLPKNQTGRIAGLGLMCIVAVSGCRQQPPNQPEEISISYGGTTLGKGTVSYSQFKGRHKGAPGGQTVMICSDFNGNHASGPGDISKHQGSQSSTDGKRRLDWQTERTEGWNVKVRLNGKEYDASKGAVFLVKTEGDKTEVEQLVKDLSALQADPKSVEEFARKDAAVSKFLGIKAD